jgi:putative ABC transport system ATP-binding protein
MIKFDSVYLKREDKEIFSGLNFSVQRDEKVLIQGKSGIGKTTLFKVLLGFETIDSGGVLFNNLAIVKENIRDIRQQIFYLSQDIDLRGQEKVRSLLDEILEHNQIKQDAIKKSSDNRINQFMDFLDLNTKILNRPVKELSGGERQRVGLLICFALDRPVWLLDEPTSALDDAMKEKIVNYITDQNKTIVIISHDQAWKTSHAIKIERWT